MGFILRTGLILALYLSSALAYSSSILAQHVIAVSQSMSAFYMYSLSEGDNRYKIEYEQYFKEAEAQLVKLKAYDTLLAKELQQSWGKLKPVLKYDYVDGAGFIIPLSARHLFREYLNRIYEQYINGPVQTHVHLTDLERVGLKIEVMGARFFDVSSALYGTVTLSNKDSAIDPITMAKSLNEELDQILASEVDDKAKRNIRMALMKWRFIENNVINYKGEAAYLLVYYNKGQIKKLLNKSRVLLAEGSI